jgi:cellulose synthase/poly-beta-1,6-N-acetylglucosamine synthase-like glycosyltransferase
MKITVIVPTYRRPKDLARCLQALDKQTRPADEVLVVIRDTDTETWSFLETFNSESLPLLTMTVKVPGVIAAMNMGLDEAHGEIVAFTDDDSEPHIDWLKRIETQFLSDDLIGGVGGRDWTYGGRGQIYKEIRRLVDKEQETVGKVQWAGRVIGNHNLGVGKAREVDILKGVNMSYRRSAIANMRFDERMRGTGAQVHFEIGFCLALKQKGWKLIYDPMVAVDHYPAQRFDEDKRIKFNKIALTNAVHNETLALLDYLPSARRTIFLIWAILFGTRDAPGLVQWFRLLPKEGTLAAQKWLASLLGRWQGWLSWQKGRRTHLTSSKYI